MFNTLLRYDDDMNIVGDLAERWEVSEGGTVYTFTLREGVRFHHGREVVAEDVVASWNRLFDPAVASPGTDFYRVIAGADAVLAGEAEALSGLQATDRYTVRVELESPDAAFPNVVAMLFGSVVPIEVVEDKGDRWAMEPVGTGPFVVESRIIGEKTVFSRNPDYFEEGLPYLDEVVFLADIPRSLQFMKLESDQLHQVNRLTSPDYLWIKRNPAWSAQLVEYASVDTYGELMNTEMPPFDDVWFRRAVSAAIDREKLRKLRNGRLATTVSWVPPALDGHADWDEMSAEDREAFKWQRYDPALAREALAKAGYPDGYPTPIRYWTIDSEGSLVASLSVQQDLAEVGIPVEIKLVTSSTYFTAAGRRDTVPFAYTAWVMDYPHQRNFLEARFHSKAIADENSTNDAFYSNPEVDALLDAAAAATDPAEQRDLYWQAHRIIASDAPYAFEYHSTGVSVTQPYVKGFQVHPVYTRDMTRAWLDLPGGREAP